jgi:hypothetical protein
VAQKQRYERGEPRWGYARKTVGLIVKSIPTILTLDCLCVGYFMVGFGSTGSHQNAVLAGCRQSDGFGPWAFALWMV